MFEILDSQSPKFQSREICTDFQTSLLITSGTCLFLSKGMRLRFQKCTQMCLFWYLVATLDTLYILSLYYHFSLISSLEAVAAMPIFHIGVRKSCLAIVTAQFRRLDLNLCCLSSLVETFQ